MASSAAFVAVFAAAAARAASSSKGNRGTARADASILALARLTWLGLLPQSGPPFLDLPQLPGLRVPAAQPGERGLGVVPFLPRGCERLDDPGVLRLQIGDRGLVDAGVLLREELLERIDGALLRRRQTLRLFPHPLVDVEPQQRAEHAAPVSRLRFEEAGELALRQHHGLHEGGRGEPQDLLNLIGRGAHLVRQIPEGAASVVLLQADHLNAVAPESPRDAVAARADVEVQHHGDPVPGRRDHLGPLVVVDPGDLAVEREDDRVQQSRLAGSRRPRDGEQLERAEVDLLLLAEAREPLDGEMDGTQRSILPGGLVVEILELVQDGQVRRVLVRAEMIGGVVPHRRNAGLQTDVRRAPRPRGARRARRARWGAARGPFD